MRLPRLQEGGLIIGAAVTQEELIDKLLELTAAPSAGTKLAAATSEAASSFMGGFSRLWGGASSGAAASSADPKHVWLPIAKHLQRIAGNQVRPTFIKAATLLIQGRTRATRCEGVECLQRSTQYCSTQEVVSVALCTRV